ncbi:UdgX family uracil-DNA binding protein [Cupriavidus respiraculi]|uniref:UdgX family uracil-DNA binding protein n=1 Tax=Cupriavidus respiraculi TaxID=195930 RepID=UPI001C95BD0D|nr:UdgX family uracil-DNA binding protein [Cupriavidus respiraculi]
MTRPPDDNAKPDALHPDDQAPRSLEECRRCDLWRNATQGVPGEGPASARVMVVGEQPGDQEDLQGAPFVGPAGRMLDTAFERAGLARDKVYMTNAVKHFKWEPRGKRRLHKTPAQQEIEACGYWLDSELSTVRPDVVVTLGATALKAVLGKKTVAISKVLGMAIEHEGRKVIATYHPSYVLRVPDQAAKQAAFERIVEALRMAARLSAAPPSRKGRSTATTTAKAADAGAVATPKTPVAGTAARKRATAPGAARKGTRRLDNSGGGGKNEK